MQLSCQSQITEMKGVIGDGARFTFGNMPKVKRALEFLHNSGGSRLKQLWGAAFEGKGIEQWSLLGHFLS